MVMSAATQNGQVGGMGSCSSLSRHMFATDYWAPITRVSAVWGGIIAAADRADLSIVRHEGYASPAEFIIPA